MDLKSNIVCLIRCSQRTEINILLSRLCKVYGIIGDALG